MWKQGRYRIVPLSFSRSLKYGNMYLHPGPWLFSVLEPELCAQPPRDYSWSLSLFPGSLVNILKDSLLTSCGCFLLVCTSWSHLEWPHELSSESYRDIVFLVMYSEVSKSLEKTAWETLHRFLLSLGFCWVLVVLPDLLWLTFL